MTQELGYVKTMEKWLEVVCSSNDWPFGFIAILLIPCHVCVCSSRFKEFVNYSINIYCLKTVYFVIHSKSLYPILSSNLTNHHPAASLAVTFAVFARLLRTRSQATTAWSGRHTTTMFGAVKTIIFPQGQPANFRGSSPKIGRFVQWCLKKMTPKNCAVDIDLLCFGFTGKVDNMI